MKNLLLFLVSCIAICSAVSADPKIERYICLDKSSPSLTWKAFKFSSKAAVPGTFKAIRYSVADKAKSIESLLKTIKFEVDTSSVNTYNPARDETLKSNFFSKFLPIIKGKIESVNKNQISVVLSINNFSRKVVFLYSLDDSLNFKAHAKIELFDFGLKEAHNSIHKACLTLHTGTDGVSKTWSEIDLEISARFMEADCKAVARKQPQ